MLHQRSPVSGAALVVALLLAQETTAQSPEWHQIQGGTLQGVFALDANRLWTAEDGGRIRYSLDGGTLWEFADVDDDVHGDLRGVFICNCRLKPTWTEFG